MNRGLELDSVPIETGEQVLELFGYGGLVPWKNVLWLGILTLTYRLVTWLLLKLKRMRLGIRKGGSNDVTTPKSRIGANAVLNEKAEESKIG